MLKGHQRLTAMNLPFDRATSVVLLAITVVLSLTMIRSPGTSDVPVFLEEMGAVYRNGLAYGYSADFRWSGDFPPVGYAILYAAGALGNAVGLPPLMSFKVMIFAFQLISTGMVLLLSGDFWIAAGFCASILLSSVALGYMDVFVAPFLIGAFWAFQLKRNVLGAASYMIAFLIKWQPLIVAPFVALYLLEISDLQSVRRAFGMRLFWHLASLVVLTVALLGFFFGFGVAHSLWDKMRDPCGCALNLPWLAGFFYKLLFSTSGATTQAELTQLPSAYLMPVRIVFWIVFSTVFIYAMRSKKTLTNCLLFSILGFVTYVIWNSGVHENHLFVAVVLAFMLMLHERTHEHWAIVTTLAVMLNVNMFLFYGVDGTARLSPVVGIDLSVILALLYAIAWLLLALYALGAAHGDTT